MLGTIILATVTIFGNPPADLPLERLDSGYCEASGDVLLPCVPAACVPTHCEDYIVKDDDSLLCADDDELFPTGHWAFDIGPDQGDIQVMVEY